MTTIDVRIRLAALWTSVMLLYIYADYFGLYIPGRLQKMISGQMPPLGPTTQSVLLFTSAMMAIPSAMIFLSVALPRAVNRVLNIVFGTLYTIIILVTMWDWWFFVVYGVIEIALTSLVVWYAATWRTESSGAPTH